MREHHHASPLVVLVVATAVASLGAVAARVSPAPSHPQAVKSDAERAAHMQVHFSQVMTAHDAVIRGDLAGARAPAAWLAEHEAPSSLSTGAASLVAEMRRAARRTAQASTILEAALGTADMLKTCGDCHRSVGATPAVPQAVGLDVGGVVGHMLAHQRAADRMLQGLIVPSSAAWRAGADGFSTAALHVQSLPRDAALTSELIASENRIHELAVQAGRAENAGARAVFYGQIIARCADCHAAHPGVWGPTRR